MDAHTIVSRRSLLKKAPIAVVATALPTVAVAAPLADETDGLIGLPLAAVHIERAVAAMAGPMVRGHWSVTIYSGQPDQYWGFRQEFSEVTMAISLHKRTRAAYMAAIDAEEAIHERLQSDPSYSSQPLVQYGWLRQGVNDDGTDQRRPLYARSIEELDELCERECGSRLAIWGERGAERTRERYEALKSDLASQIRRKQRKERKAGLPAAIRATRAASREEERAIVAVILAKPRDRAERHAKRNYMRGKDCFKVDYWDADSLMAALWLNVEARGL